MTKITKEKMFDAGLASQQMRWTDQDILDQIKALDLVIEYLRGRTDSKLVVFALILEREKFISFKSARGI